MNVPKSYMHHHCGPEDEKEMEGDRYLGGS